MSALTKAGDWWTAYQSGQRLPEHALALTPPFTPAEAAVFELCSVEPSSSPFCDLCGQPATADDFCEAVSLVVCPTCIEAHPQ
ncbi:hypothetical protein [Phenylobacterium deserti]|uniref:Uncharacterized protein n=1 Tax=Phenylobacterium deserti TaxID=1914756 RepID=A0A328ABT1_9CAUL|nr:hypothetical protein [Phenylobacterium deserti]RAK52100.1 hypothetical protein DJ018_13170 [Phenylobacterium deserti]